MNTPSHDFRPTLMIGILFLSLLGTFYPIFLHDGSASAQFLENLDLVETVHDQQVEDFMAAHLYGEGDPSKATLDFDQNPRFDGSVYYFYDKIIAGFLLACMALLLVPRFDFLRHSLWLVSAWLLVNAVAVSLNGGRAFSHLAVLAHATRWGFPLALWMIFSTRGAPVGRATKIFIALGIAMTFAAHGWEAVHQNPQFKDLILGSALTFGFEVDQAVVEKLLLAIGTMDLLLAAIVLIRPRPGILLWMTFWGLVTALSRMTAAGPTAWPDTAMRLANGCMPLLLYTLIRQPLPTIKDQT